MQFAPTDTQEAVRGVAAEALERAGDSPESAWQALADAGLLALAVPEQHSGEGHGLQEVAVLLHEVGRRAVHVPVWETLVCGVLPLARVGTAEQQQRLLPGVAEGKSLLTAALQEPCSGLTTQPWRPTTVLGRVGDRWSLTGTKVGVWGAGAARAILVPALLDDDHGVVVVLLDPGAEGVTLTESRSARGEIEHTLRLDAVPVTDDDVLGGAPGSPEARAAAVALRELATAGLCLLAGGLVAGARDLTAGYIKQRRQFGRSVAEFQAAAMQMADVYIASRTIDLAATAAGRRVANELPADDDLAVAAYWFVVEGPEALHTCHHLHGGTGVDITYPLHRSYSWAKDIVRVLGGVQQALRSVPVEETAGKNLELTEEQRRFKEETREYFEQLVSDDDRRTQASVRATSSPRAAPGGSMTSRVAISAAVQVGFERIDDELTLPHWRVVAEESETHSSRPGEGALPRWELPVTTTLVVSTALATRDYQDVHHDRDLAVQRGSNDIFLNILTTGLVQRYVGEWTGHAGIVRSCELRLGARAHPGDTLVFEGTVSEVLDVDGETRHVVDVVGSVPLGAHVTARVTVVLPGQEAS